MLTSLRTLTVAALLVASANAQTNPAAQNAKPKPKILVLGAGMSGVMTATTLYQKGFTDITIIEANDYIGGRMRSGSFAGRHIEYGANWVHGISDNPIYNYAKSKGVNLVETNWSSVTYLPVGADPNAEQEAEEFDEVQEKVDERAKKYLAAGKKDLAVDDAYRYEGWTAHTPLEQALLYNDIDLDMGPAHETSFELGLNIATYAGDDHDMLVVDSKGYNNLAYTLLDKYFPNPLTNKNVILNSKVKSIVYTDKGVTVTAKNSKTDVTTTYSADFVVTTFSAGVLKKKALTLFSPTLPEDKLDAIFRVDMTLFLKVFVETTEKFWADVTGGSETWIYADKLVGNYTSWMDLSVPKLASGFSNTKNSTTGSFMAMCMLGSDFAERTQQLSNDQIRDEVIHVMRAMFPKAASRIDTKTVTSITVHRWGQDDLFVGSWSNPRPDFTKADFAKLAEPVGRLYFSGEHTSPEYFGYVHGAYRAGIATAQQLMKRPEFQ